MLKHIDFRKTEGIAMAVTQNLSPDTQESIWNVYLLNLKEDPIESVLVSSKGYGKQDKEKVKTSELRQFIPKIEAKSCIQIEILTPELIGIHNQFWVSYTYQNFLYDRKFVFLAETIRPDFFTEIPLLNERGILIK